MYSIGEFSQITGLTIKAIHLYHERGLLVPVVDESSGYRYFHSRSVEKARAIRLLKEMTFSLSEIAEILKDCEDESEILDYLERRKAAIEAQLRQLHSVSLSIDNILKCEREAIAMSKNSSFDIIEKEVAPLLVASLRWTGKYSDSGKAFSKLGKAVGLGMAGKPLGLYYDHEYKEDGADIESCIPVRKPIRAEEIKTRELPAGKFVTLIHHGPFDQLSRSYGKLFDYIKSKNYKAVWPLREIYVKGPGMIFKGNPKKYLTEIQIGVEPA